MTIYLSTFELFGGMAILYAWILLISNTYKLNCIHKQQKLQLIFNNIQSKEIELIFKQLKEFRK